MKEFIAIMWCLAALMSVCILAQMLYTGIKNATSRRTRSKYIDPKFVSKSDILIINDNNDHLSATLGITVERRDYLLDRIYYMISKGRSNHGILEEVSKECKHTNETSYCAYALGFITAKDPVPQDFTYLQ